MSNKRSRATVPGSRAPQRAYVLHPAVKAARVTEVSGNIAYLRDQDLKLEEAVGLAMAIGVSVEGAAVVELGTPNPATFLGKGKVEDYAELFEGLEIEIVVMDCTLSPVQQRNLEKAWKVKVLDRTGLILEIFGERARTKEGTLQVELAHLTYQKSRLVRTWTHLERQRGGYGFMGGPGERQIEADRRQIQERITRIKKELETVAKRRTLHRKARKEVPYPIVALAGYTNAGKSTLFNRLTGAAVSSRSRLFETLDPTLRSIKLPGGRKIILSDTVGFISNLPTELVAAFRATLEEVREADLILHVRDASNPEMDAQKADVLEVLHSLGVAENTPVLEVLNKIDLVDAEVAESLASHCRRSGDCITLSALEGQGTEKLLQMIAGGFDALEPRVRVTLDSGEGEARAWAYQHGSILDEKERDGNVILELRLGEKAIGQFEKKFPDAKIARLKKVKKTA